MKAHHPDAEHGFTLVELLAVITIIVLLASALVVAVGYFSKRAMQARTWSVIKIAEGAINAFQQDYGVYPPEDCRSYNAHFFADETLSNNPFNKEEGSVEWKPPYKFEVYDDNEFDFSSEILYYFLYQRIHDEEDSDVLKILKRRSPYVEFPEYAVKDNDGDGHMEIVDAWGNPLLYVAKDLYEELGETQATDGNIEPHENKNYDSYCLYSYGSDGLGLYLETEDGEEPYPVQSIRSDIQFSEDDMQTAIDDRYTGDSDERIAQANRDDIVNWQSQ